MKSNSQQRGALRVLFASREYVVIVMRSDQVPNMGSRDLVESENRSILESHGNRKAPIAMLTAIIVRQQQENRCPNNQV